MNPWIEPLIIILISLSASTGLGFLIWWWRHEHPGFRARVISTLPQSAASKPTLSHYLRTLLWRLLDAIGSTRNSVEKRLLLAGGKEEIHSFRLQQLICAITCMCLCAALASTRLARSYFAGAAFVIVAMLVGFTTGLAAWDAQLSSRAKKRQHAIENAVPDIAELLALAVAAGESMSGALERICVCSGDALGEELRIAVGHIRLGTPTTQALNELTQRNNSPSLTRLCHTMVTAIERGSPLAGVLHDQARDQRERSLASLMEEGGKRDIAMLIPVVFLILPVTVLFALYPGLIALDVTP